LLQAFKNAHGDIKIKAVLGDALYGETVFMDEASRIFDITQVISQLRENQNIEYKGKKGNLKDYLIPPTKAWKWLYGCVAVKKLKRR